MKKKKKVGGLTKIAVAVFAVYATFTMVSLQLQISQKKEEKRLFWKARIPTSMWPASPGNSWAMSPLANGSLWTLLANKTERVTKRIWS